MPRAELRAQTFKKRFQPFPVRIEMLSRFRTPKEIKAVLADVAEGKVDLVVGTHRLFSKDVDGRISGSSSSMKSSASA